MVEAAKQGKPPPNDEYKIMLLCQMFNCLPSQLENEDAHFLDRMILFTNTYNAVRQRRQAIGEEIHKLPEGVSKVLAMLDDMGINYSGLT